MKNKQIDPGLYIAHLIDKKGRFAWVWTTRDKDGTPVEHYFFPKKFSFVRVPGDIIKIKATKIQASNLKQFEKYVLKELRRLKIPTKNVRYVQAPQIQMAWSPATELQKLDENMAVARKKMKKLAIKI